MVTECCLVQTSQASSPTRLQRNTNNWGVFLLLSSILIYNPQREKTKQKVGVYALEC